MNRIGGKTKVCGLIGNPVEHTLSPLIHNTLAAEMAQDTIYVPFPVEPDRIGEAIRGAFALHITGLNITVPYKSAVLPFLESTSLLAAAIGAVNTLIRSSKGYIGHNTDIEGLYRAMQNENILIADEDVILLGAGGASRAAAFLCAEKKAKSLAILNRSPQKAEELAGEVNQAAGRVCATGMALSDHANLPDKKHLAIQATSVGLYPNHSNVIIEEPSFYQKIHTGYDLIYTPFTTKFMTLTESHGGKAFNGLKMLLFQAIIAYELIHQVTIPDNLTEQIYIKLKEVCIQNES